MALILSLETSSEVCSVCLHENEKILSIIETKEAFSHTRKITLFITECLKIANKEIHQLNAIAISDGPGSYTGLRVAASTAKGMCYALGIPMIAVDTLKAIAHHASLTFPGAMYFPMVDARRMEVYTSIFDASLNHLKETYNLILEKEVFEEWEISNQKMVLCGTGVEKVKMLFAEKKYELMPFELSSSHMVSLAIRKFENKFFENIISYEPNYYKAPKVTRSTKALF